MNNNRTYRQRKKNIVDTAVTIKSINIPFAPLDWCDIWDSLQIVTHSCGFFRSQDLIFGFLVRLLEIPANYFTNKTPQERVKPAQGGSKPRRRGQICAGRVKLLLWMRNNAQEGVNFLQESEKLVKKSEIMCKGLEIFRREGKIYCRDTR